MITAIVLVETAPSLIPEVAQSIADLPRVHEVYSVTGDVDLIALVRVRQCLHRSPPKPLDTFAIQYWVVVLSGVKG